MENIVCRDCGGSGKDCETCTGSGYYTTASMNDRKPASFADIPIVPMPLGKLEYPHLMGSYENQNEYTRLDSRIYCPECESDHVMYLPAHSCWFCTACHESWKYEREH